VGVKRDLGMVGRFGLVVVLVCLRILPSGQGVFLSWLCEPSCPSWIFTERAPRVGEIRGRYDGTIVSQLTGQLCMWKLCQCRNF
jgi:hypothetical protein